MKLRRPAAPHAWRQDFGADSTIFLRPARVPLTLYSAGAYLYLGELEALYESRDGDKAFWIAPDADE